MDKQHRYYATIDPLDENKSAFWFMDKRGRLRPWPLRRNKWGVLLKKDVDAHATNHPFSDPEGASFVRDHFDKVRGAREAVQRMIENDPELCAARFARFACRCCCCGKVLIEDRSKIYGIGPECRKGVSPEWLSRTIELVKRAYREEELSRQAG